MPQLENLPANTYMKTFIAELGHNGSFIISVIVAKVRTTRRDNFVIVVGHILKTKLSSRSNICNVH